MMLEGIQIEFDNGVELFNVECAKSLEVFILQEMYTAAWLFCLINVALCMRESNRLYEDLLRNYNRLVRPSRQASDAVYIEFKFKLLQILDLHEKVQVLKTSGLLHHVWTDYRLMWDPQAYGNVTRLHIPGLKIWLPDIILYNNADGRPTPSTITKAKIYYNGSIHWNPPATYNSLCLLDTEWFPYDQQRCEMKFGSWTYSGDELQMIHPEPDELIENITMADGSVELKVNVGNLWSLTYYLANYPCCDFPAIDITYDLVIRRKKLFFTINLMIPCIGIALLSSFVFCRVTFEVFAIHMPNESKNKITLCISVLVSLTVFFLLLIEIIPPTSLAIPLIGKYLLFTMVMVTLSIVLSIIVLSIHHQGNRPMPAYIRRIFIDFLGNYILIYKKPSELRRKPRKVS
ncbi:Acetylcholine receptor subunit alpha-type unc-63 [Aphelenchoides bicaudatus]|nr:Acetylcholine receptor subunit alpha-type unc-63 [Aphelenchoides bicaudatus]